MNLTVRGNNIQITPEFEAYVDDKLSKLERYLPNIESLYVEVSLQKSNRGPDVVSAQITLRHNRGAILRTEEKLDREDRNTVKVAVNAASDKMYRRIRRFKNKKRSKRMREAYAMSQDEYTIAEPLPDETDTREYDNVPDTGVAVEDILRRKQVNVMAMAEEEAIEQMELLGHDFFMYYNPDTSAVNVVYRRKNGGYGLLEPVLQ
jgi:putative sigma-54 modulation protein